MGIHYFPGDGLNYPPRTDGGICPPVFNHLYAVDENRFHPRGLNNSFKKMQHLPAGFTNIRITPATMFKEKIGFVPVLFLCPHHFAGKGKRGRSNELTLVIIYIICIACVVDILCYPYMVALGSFLKTIDCYHLKKSTLFC